MAKTLYSLMLNDDVVRELDILAHQRGMNRSSLINQILADYVEVTTPERWISDVFQSVERLLAPSRELVPYVVPNSKAMSMKSSLAYKYRPTVKYEVELRRVGTTGSGTLSVIFRTQSAALIQDMTNFFRLWKQLEDQWLTEQGQPCRQYELYDGKFLRSIRLPDGMGNNENVAQAIADYVQIFDRLMKAYLAQELPPEQFQVQFRRDMAAMPMIL